MKTNATYFVNDPVCSLRYGEAELINPPRQRLRGEPLKTGVRAVPVFCGFCGTDMELMRMGLRGALGPKFPAGQTRLINGHEGVVWVPDEERFAIVLIRGGDSWDPTRFTEDETYFEYGCDGADGIFCDMGYFHPDMLLRLPPKYEGIQKLPLSLAKRLVFSDPYACAVFQRERMEDLGAAQNFRVEMAKRGCAPQEGMAYAREALFERTVIFGLGTTGLFIGDQIRRNHPAARILFAARSPKTSPKAVFATGTLGCEYLSTGDMDAKQAADAIIEALGGRATVFVGASGSGAEHRVALEYGALGCNGIYNSFSLGPEVRFDSMPFGFHNNLIMASINFTRAHMEQAIGILSESTFDTLVELIDKETFIADPADAYVNRIYAKNAPLKTAVVWNADYMDMEENA